MTELKNCPFCGSEADGPNETDFGDEYWIQCTNPECRVTIEMETEAEAIKAWNTRTENVCVPKIDSDICPNCEQPLMCGQDGLPFCFGCGYTEEEK